MPARLPDFLGLGTQKGGTTSLHKWLRGHPQIYLPECKEVHYFDLNHEMDINWYKNHFKDTSENQKCGEITPFYLYHPKVASRIHKLLPKVKMIILLRDPAERAISQILHAKRKGFEPLSPEEAIAKESERLQQGGVWNLQKHSYIGRSKYLEQLDRYEAIFKKDQMLILKSEDLFENPAKEWIKISEFLDIRSDVKIPEMQRTNEGIGINEDLKNRLREKIRKELQTTAEGIKERYGFGWEWD